MNLEFKPKYQQVPAGLLKVDSSYQRRLDKTFVKEQGTNFNADAFGVIHVSQRADGSLWTIDGQHRVKMLPFAFPSDWNKQNVPALVYTGLDVKQEAERFEELNRTKQMRTFDRFRARLKAEDPVALDIQKISRDAGYTIADGGLAFNCVSALERIYHGTRAQNVSFGPENLKATLSLTAKAWGTRAPHPTTPIVLGLGTFVERYRSDFSAERLGKRLKYWSGGWFSLLGKARARREADGGSLARAVFEVVRIDYNKGLRGKKLNSLWKEEN